MIKKIEILCYIVLMYISSENVLKILKNIYISELEVLVSTINLYIPGNKLEFYLLHF